MIPYGKQEITEDDITSVINVLRSDLITQGPVVEEFENSLAHYCKSRFAVSFNSATSALHAACSALNIGHGDMVWTSPISFVASANCAIYCGAVIDFVDIDPQTYCMSVSALKFKLEEAKTLGILPKVVIPVHLGGNLCDMEAIAILSKSYGFKVIEDASHATGASFDGVQTGSCTHSDITVFSFHPVKNITSGEGGSALTNSSDINSKLKLFRSHGITRDQNEMVNKKDDPCYYEQISLGYNYRLSDIHAALGLSQLKRLNEYIEKRNRIAKNYDSLLKHLPITLQNIPAGTISAFHLYIIRIDRNKVKNDIGLVRKLMRKSGIGVNVHYIPIHLQPFYANLGFKSGDFPESEKYYMEALSLPMYPTLTIEQIEYIAGKLGQALSQ